MGSPHTLPWSADFGSQIVTHSLSSDFLTLLRFFPMEAMEVMEVMEAMEVSLMAMAEVMATPMDMASTRCTTQ